MVAATAYMARKERLYAVDLAVAADDGNDDGGSRGGEAGAPGGDGIACVNGQAAATAAAVEEEQEEGAADHDGDRMADGNGGPVAHSDRKDGDGSAAPRSGRMTTTTATTAVGGGAAAIIRKVLTAAVIVIVVVVVAACGAVRRRAVFRSGHPADDAAGTHPPGPAVIVPCAVITTSDSIWENGPHFTTTDIKTILPPLTPTPHRCRPRWAASSPSPPARLSPSPTPARFETPQWPRPNPPGRGITGEATGKSAPPAP
jgi:hypothetical protein